MQKKSAGEVRLMLVMPRDLHRRLLAVSKPRRTSMSQLAREAITERIEFLEEKARVEEERAKAEREARQGLKRFAPFRKMSSVPLPTLPTMPSLGSLTPRTPTPAAASPSDETKGLPVEYGVHADHILEATLANDILEARVRTMEGVAAIRRRAPLSCPPDLEIMKTLQQLVDEKRAAIPIVDGLEGKKIDVSKMRSTIDPSVLEGMEDEEPT